MSHVTYEWALAHMNETWHIWMSHGTYVWVMSPKAKDTIMQRCKNLTHVCSNEACQACSNESCHVYASCHVCSNVTYTVTSHVTYRVMSHVRVTPPRMWSRRRVCCKWVRDMSPESRRCICGKWVCDMSHVTNAVSSHVTHVVMSRAIYEWVVSHE